MVLHNSPVQVHGRLKSSNCLIDSRWVCKIGDWGLSELRSPSDRLKPQEEHEKYNGRLRDVCQNQKTIFILASNSVKIFQKRSIWLKILNRHFSTVFSVNAKSSSLSTLLWSAATLSPLLCLS